MFRALFCSAPPGSLPASLIVTRDTSLPHDSDDFEQNAAVETFSTLVILPPECEKAERLFHPVVAVQHRAKLDSSHVPLKSFHQATFAEFVLLCQHVMLISEMMLTFNY